MKEEQIDRTEQRLWNQALREGTVEGLGQEGADKIRQAFREVAGDIQSLENLLTAVSEIMASAATELEAKLRLKAALHRRVWRRLLERLPDDARQEIEREIRTLNLKDLAL